MSSGGLESSATSSSAEPTGEIYSSEGLPPLEAPEAPVQTGIPEVENGVLDSGHGVDLVQAFEVFSGRLFFPDQRQAAASTNISTKETPLQRLARLRMEVDELEQDLRAAAVDSEESDGEVLGTDVLRGLTDRLVAVENDKRHKRLLHPPQTTQADLTNLVSQQLERLSRGGGDGGSFSSQPEGTAANNSNSALGVTYELYPGSGGTGSTLSLEERMSKIERLVGGSSGAGSASILERLDQAESLVKRLDVKSLDAAAARAKLIRVDLEAAAKSKAKLAGSSSNATTPEDASTISALYDQMQACEGLTDELPALVSRLTDLQILHGQAADFGSRLSTLETIVSQVDRTLQTLEDVADRVEKGCVDNVKTMESNLKLLDEKMNQLRGMNAMK